MSTILGVDIDRQRSYVTFVSLVLAAWLALTVWSLSPYAAWLDHARIEDIAADPTVRLAVFTLGWTLMVVAMMLPGTLLLLARCQENGSFGVRRLAPLILAYLVVWAVFGAVIYWGDSVLHEIVEQAPPLADFIAPGVLLVAGAYQLTPMKRACLARCRPEGGAFKTFMPSSRRYRWTLGLRHGIVCLGSCWALMLLMFASGGVNLLWMLALSISLAAERFLDKGTLLARILGLTLLLCSLMAFLR